MAVTLDSSNIYTISDCSTATNWSASHTLANTLDNYREGTSSNGLLKVSDTTGWAKFDYFTQNTAYLDMTINSRHLYLWFNFAQAHYITSILLTAEDASGNIGYWNMGTSFPGGWVSYTVDMGRAFDSNNGTDPTTTAIRYLGIQFIVDGKVSGNVQNCWLDYMHYAEGPLLVKGGGVGTEGTFQEIYEASESTTNAYGFMGNWEGAYSIKGPIQIGDPDTGSSYFKDANTSVFGADLPVASDWLKISTVGNTTGTNLFVLGEASGTAGINGCQIKSAGASKVICDFSDANMDTMGVYGTSFTDCGDISLPAASATKNFISNSLIGCGTLIANTCKTEGFLIVAPDDYGIKMIPGHAIKNGQLINAPNGVWIEPTAADQEFNFDAIIFTGGDGITYYDIYTNTIYDIIANMLNGSNAAYDNAVGTGTISIENAVGLTIGASVSLVGAEVRIYDMDGVAADYGTELAGTESHNAATYLYSGDGGNYIWIQIMLNGYEEFGQSYTIPTSDGTFTATLKPELNG